MTIDYWESTIEEQKEYLRKRGWIESDKYNWWIDPIIPDCWQPFSDALLEQMCRNKIPNPLTDD